MSRCYFFKGDISIDDFTFTTSNCSIRPLNEAVPTVPTTIPATLSTTSTRRSTLAPQSPWDCNFETGQLCPTWTHDLANFRWTLTQGQTPSFNTGPTAGMWNEFLSNHARQSFFQITLTVHPMVGTSTWKPVHLRSTTTVVVFKVKRSPGENVYNSGRVLLSPWIDRCCKHSILGITCTAWTLTRWTSTWKSTVNSGNQSGLDRERKVSCLPLVFGGKLTHSRAIVLRESMAERSIFDLPSQQWHQISDRLRRHRRPVSFSTRKEFFEEVGIHHLLSRYGLGDIALDDIVVYQSCPNEDRLCTFEDPAICNYLNDAGSQYNWVRTTGDDPLATGFKPTTDHTDGTSNGAYMLVDISKSSSTVNNQRARLTSPVLMPNGEQCVEYWYYTDAEALSTASKLNLYVRTSTQPTNTSGYLIASQSVLRVSGFNERWLILSLCCLRRIDNGVSLNNEFHMVSPWHPTKWSSKVSSSKSVRIPLWLPSMMSSYVIELAWNPATAISRMGV